MQKRTITLFLIVLVCFSILTIFNLTGKVTNTRTLEAACAQQGSYVTSGTACCAGSMRAAGELGVLCVPQRQTCAIEGQLLGPSTRIKCCTGLDLRNGICKSTTTQNIIKTEGIITAHNYFTNYKDVPVKYDIYYTPNSNFRVVCQQPCQISEEILKNKVIGAQTAINKLLSLTKIDVLDILKPVDIHLTSDTECGIYGQGVLVNVGGSANTRTPSKGAYVCLWEYDKDMILPINPKYATPKGLNAVENAKRIESQTLLIHEYSHILFYVRSFNSPDGWVHTLSLKVSGIWYGNGYSPNNFRELTSTKDTVLNNEFSALDIYNLGTRCGFTMEQIGTVLKEIDNIYQTGRGEKIIYRNGIAYKEVSTPQFKKIVDKITNKDSVRDCGVPWLGET